MKIRVESINQAWLSIMKALSTDGKKSSPRGQEITEIKNMSVEITNPKKRILSTPIRKMSLPFAFGEFLWYYSARNDVDMMTYYAKNMANFSDDGETLNSAYGYRIFGKHPQIGFDQWDNVVKRLKADPDSRQAIIHLHTPNNKPTKDEVCTLTLQFMIRGGKLDMFTNMRSNDIVWGFTYDVFSFTTIQELMANELGVEVGTYHHTATSMHVYEKDYNMMRSAADSFNALYYATQYDTEFSYEGLTRYSPDWGTLLHIEAIYRDEKNNSSGNLLIDHETLKIMSETLMLYKVYKVHGKERVKAMLDYDNIYHCIFRNAISGKTLKDSKLVIVEGADGSGKSTYINNRNEELGIESDVINFSKPDNFDKQIYFHTAWLSGDITLDRFFYSELVYAKAIRNEEGLLNDQDRLVLESLLEKRKAKFIFLNTEPQLCLNRLDEGDQKWLDLDKLTRIQKGYEYYYVMSGLTSKVIMM